MDSKKIKHLVYTPFTGLGLYGGYRGKNWLRNRIKIFKQFVVPSLLSQTNKDFILWLSWRHEEVGDKDVLELQDYLNKVNLKNVFTYSGVCFWDDKHDNETARLKLINAVHGSIGELLNVIGEANEVLMTIQPSDDCYNSKAIEEIQRIFKETKLQAFGYAKGYMMNYLTKDVAEYNPKTNPPFYTIRFPRDVFADPLKHLKYTGIKNDVNQYKAGTPLPSHEYLPDVFGNKYAASEKRGFIVGCHGYNISTVFDHPYKGGSVNQDVLKDFGLDDADKLVLPFSFRNLIFRKLPYQVKRKLRYWAGEKRWVLRPFFSVIYNALRA